MSRLAPSVIALVTAAGLWSGSALAADTDFFGGDEEGYGEFRDAYPVTPAQWAGLGDEDDPLRLEFGVRYWYSIGGHEFTTGGGTFTSEDTAHSGELHLRVEDHSTNSFAKAIAGYTFLIDGSYSDPFSSGSVSDGQVGYIGADFGWNAFGDNNGSGVGILTGYQYWNDSPNTTRASYTTQTGETPVAYDPDTGETFLPFDSSENNIDIHALRLGIQGKANLGGYFDLDGELVAVPYAKVNGIIGADETTTTFTPLGNIGSVKSSPTTIDGWGYGAMGQVMVGFHPTENLTFRVGGRAWYLQGTVDSTYSQATISDPSDSLPPDPGPPIEPNLPNYDTPPTFSNQAFIETANPFSMIRYGLLAEMTYAF